MNKLLMVSLSAALISIRMSGIAEAAYSERDINRMEELISAGNWVDLRIFLLGNPSVLTGNDQFTQQLQKFLEETDSLYTALTFDPSIFPDLDIATPTAPVARSNVPATVARRDNSGSNSVPARNRGRNRPGPLPNAASAGAVSIY